MYPLAIVSIDTGCTLFKSILVLQGRVGKRDK